jgi:hypothetical protein
MGWTTSYDWQHLRSIIFHLTATSTNGNGTKWETATKSYRGAPYKGTLWTLGKNTKADGTIVQYIGCFLIKYYGKREGFGYKDMDASMHQFQYNCPISYLLEDLVYDTDGSKDFIPWVGGVLSKYKNKESKNYKKAVAKYPTAIKAYEDYIAERLANPFVPTKMVTVQEMFPDGIPSIDPV